MPAYDPPTLGEMKTVIRRALRDDGTVFPTDLLGDFVNEALADLSLFRPREWTITLAFDPTLYASHGLDPADYAIMTYVWRVTVRNGDQQDSVPAVIPFHSEGEAEVTNGWDYYNKMVTFGRYILNRLVEWHNSTNSGLIVGLTGYRERNWPTSDASVLDLEDAVSHLCVMRYIKALGFQTLEADRSLYQQWIAATNNTDVSPTQLQGMRAQAEQAYERLRKQAGRAKRIPVAGVQYLS